MKEKEIKEFAALHKAYSVAFMRNQLIVAQAAQNGSVANGEIIRIMELTPSSLERELNEFGNKLLESKDVQEMLTAAGIDPENFLKK